MMECTLCKNHQFDNKGVIELPRVGRVDIYVCRECKQVIMINVPCTGCMYEVDGWKCGILHDNYDCYTKFEEGLV